MPVSVLDLMRAVGALQEEQRPQAPSGLGPVTTPPFNPSAGTGGVSQFPDVTQGGPSQQPSKSSGKGDAKRKALGLLFGTQDDAILDALEELLGAKKGNERAYMDPFTGGATTLPAQSGQFFGPQGAGIVAFGGGSPFPPSEAADQQAELALGVNAMTAISDLFQNEEFMGSLKKLGTGIAGLGGKLKGAIGGGKP
jgi:hypothetical protein